MIIWPVPRHRLHLHNSRPVSTQPYKGSRMDALRPPCKPRFLMLHHTPRSAAVHTDLSIHSLNPESAATPSASLPLPDPDNTICRPADPDTSPSACLCFHSGSTGFQCLCGFYPLLYIIGILPSKIISILSGLSPIYALFKYADEQKPVRLPYAT